jgi:neutral amino acid transport system substrate-binding protein
MEEQVPPPAAPSAAAPKRTAVWIAVAVVAVVAIVVAAAAFTGLLGGPGEEERTLRLGTVLSITGGLAAFGPFNQRGVQMAVDEINANGGVLGRFVQLFNQNDDSKPDTARAAATTLVSQNRVDAIVGATGSGQCSTVLEVAKANSVFEVSGSCTSPRFSNTTINGGWWARTSPSDALQGVVAAHYAQENLTFQRAAVIGINNAYGVALAQVFHDQFIRFGGQMVTPAPRIVTEVQFGASDYTADLRAVLNTNPQPQVLYVVAYPPDGVLVMDNFEAIADTEPGWRSIQIMFSEGVFDDTAFIDVLTGAPRNYDLSNVIGTAPSPFGGVRGPAYADWEEDYIAKWCIETGTPLACRGNDLEDASPRLFDDNNYDAAYLVALAAQAAGRATGDGIRSKLRDVANPPGTQIFTGEWAKARDEIAAGRDIDYEGASGSVNIDEFGDPFSGYVVWGVNATNDPVNRQIYPETLVRSILPASAPALAPLVSSAAIELRWPPEATTRRDF